MPPRRFACAALAALLALVLPSALRAQQAGVLTGVVSDSATGGPLGGALISIVGTRLGTQTAADGRYLIRNVPAGPHTVQVRRLGFVPRDLPRVAVTAGATTTLDVRMRATALQLEAVVTTGVVDPTSGTRVPFTVGRVQAEDMPVPATNAMESIQGKVAGVTVIPTGQPGSGTNIMLRTPTSINKTNSPLVVVDGVVLTQAFSASSADLDALDIESIEVVKGAAAASLYGSRAANGVVQIRTRRGAGLTEGTTRVTARSEVGTNQLSGKIDWARHHYYQTDASGQYLNSTGAVTPCATTLSDEECRALRRAQRVARPAWERFQDVGYADPVYDQVDRFFDPGQFFKNSINIGQNAGRTNWFLSLANSREDGVVLNSGRFQQSDARLNLDHRPRENLTLSVSAYHSRANRRELYGDTFFDLINQAPDVDLRRPDPDGTPYIFQPDPEGREENPLYVLATEDDRTKRARTLGSLEARFTPLGWLGLDANLSYDRSDRRSSYFLDRGAKTEGFGQGGLGRIESFTGTTDALNAAMSVNFIGRRGPLTARSTLRALMERESNDTTRSIGTNFATPGVPSLTNAQDRQIRSGRSEIRSDGYFATLGLDYDGRYIFDGLVRRDGSSLFGPEERWNTYYRVSGSYRMAEEPWWPLPVFSEFKLRASQGTAGGRPSFPDQYETYTFTAGGGVQKQNLGNRFLKPEHATETELGVDMILRDRYSVQLSYARSVVRDQLIQIPLAGPYGFSTQWQNAGTVEGNTVEATFEAQMIRRPDFTWRLGLVADRSRHEITEFNRFCFQTQTIAYRCAGETLGAMYGFRFLKAPGELPTDAQARAAEFAVNDEGLLVWVGPSNRFTEGEAKRLWGTTTTIGTTNYLWGMPIVEREASGSARVVRIGDGNPDFRFGVSNNLSWRGVSLFALVDAQLGGDAYNQTRQRMYQWAKSADVDQTGKPQELKKPIEYYVNLYNANSVVDYFVEDAGYVKLREVSLAYTVPTRFVGAIGRTGVQGVRLSLIGRNLLTWSDYRGYDPEVAGGNNPLTRIDSFDYPRYRTFTGSVEVTF